MKNKRIKNLSTAELKAIKEFKKRINQNYPVVDLKLFGSKARGEARQDSDIDILLVLKKVSEKDKDEIYDIVNDILLKHEIDLSVKIFSQKKYNFLKSIPSVFMQLVQKEAILL